MSFHEATVSQVGHDYEYLLFCGINADQIRHAFELSRNVSWADFIVDWASKMRRQVF